MARQTPDPRYGGNTDPPKKGGPPTLPPPTVTPPAKKGGSGERAVFTKFINAHPALRAYANTIWQAAGRYGGITPTQLAAVIWLESKGNPNARSSAGALGIAQIFDNTAAVTNAAGVEFFRPDHNISDADKRNPAFAIRYMAWRLSGYASTHGGSIDQTWIGGYNPDYGPGKAGYAGPNPISALLPKGYVGTAATTADQNAGKSTDTSAIKAAETNPWVIGVGKNGKLVVSTSPVPPASSIPYDGLPMQRSDFLSLRRQLDPYFTSYTGGRPDNATVLRYIKGGWSPYSLQVALSNRKGFVNSPIYKANIDGLKQSAKDLTPQGQALPIGWIRSAIVNGWNQTEWEAYLRKQPGYVNSNELKGNAATLSNVHSSIMGVPDQGGMDAIKQAALAGWSAVQYAAYLRSRPEYSQSTEYQSKALSFLDQLGLITGNMPVLRKGQNAPANQPGGFGPLPTDPRAPAGQINPESDLAVTY